MPPPDWLPPSPTYAPPALPKPAASKKLSAKEQAKADLAETRLVEAEEYASAKADYDAIRASIAPSLDRASIASAVPTTGEWALMALAQKRLWLFGHHDGELKWRAALSGGKARKVDCDAAHKTALEVARSLAVVLAPRGTGARDPDANDPKKGPADHEAMLRVRRGEGPPVADMTEDRVAWIRKNLKTYHADKKAWFNEWPGMSHSQTPPTRPSNPSTPPYLCADDDLYKYIKEVHAVVVKFTAAASSSKTRRGILVDTLTVFITNENNTTPQRSEQREVAHFAADYMIRFFLSSNGGLVNDTVSVMNRCWVCPGCLLTSPMSIS